MFATRRLLQQAASPSSSSSRSKTIGFIGLGAMGREMANNLLSKTFAENSDPAVSFVVHDVSDQVRCWLEKGRARRLTDALLPVGRA